jgi:hypothetical protein
MHQLQEHGEVVQLHLADYQEQGEAKHAKKYP